MFLDSWASREWPLKALFRLVASEKQNPEKQNRHDDEQRLSEFVVQAGRMAALSPKRFRI